MNKAKVAKIRPVSWNLYVQGREQAEHVRSVLASAGLQTSEPQTTSDLMDDSMFVFLATPDKSMTMTSSELEAILAEDERVELAFEEA